MARMNKYEARHIRNVEAYKREVQKIFDEATKEAMRMGIRFDADTGKPFSFDDYPATKRKFEALMAKMHQRLMAVVRGGVDAEYELAQDSAGAQIRSVFPALSAAQISEQLRKLANSNAKAAFEQRRKRGLGLSDKVWQYARQYKQELEMALDIGIGEGKSAQALSRDVRKYLRQPNMLFRKVRDKHGVLHLSKRAKAYHPGRGVYRSSVKNALRMVATETNIAYRSADYLNTKASPWIVGIRIVLSNNHTCKDSQGVAQPFTDICDKLAGRYPKDFKFTGWHPNCRCHIEYIHKTDAEVERDTKRMLRGEKPIEAHESKNFVGELPKSFKDWYDSNKERISRSKTTPYFIEDNERLISSGFAKFDHLSFVKKRLNEAPRNAYIELHRNEIEDFVKNAVKQSDIAIRMKEESFVQLVTSGIFKNAFETNKNSFVNKKRWDVYMQERKAFEKALFGKSGDTIYAYLESKNLDPYKGQSKQKKDYGEIVIRLKKEEINNATLTPDDSLAMYRAKDDIIGVPGRKWKKGFYRPVDMRQPNASMFVDKQTRYIDDILGTDKNKAFEFFNGRGLYMEVQIHSKIGIDKISSVTFPFSLFGKKHLAIQGYAEILEKRGIKIYRKIGEKIIEYHSKE